jgi:D-arabinan exo alpha-(1,3)/(1,5)-arabinofuranosidase (non-reducing end)
MRILLCFVMVFVLLPFGDAAPVRARGTIDELVNISQLPVLYPKGTLTRQFSSFSRDGSNNDGFSGRYSYLRFIEDSGEKSSLIADFNGPGCIYRFWGTAIPKGQIKFYFDGNSKPEIDIPFREMFDNKHYPFLKPIAGQGLGGYYSYVPIAWKKSCRIVVTSRQMRFYQITFLKFPDAKGVKSFSMKQWKKDRKKFDAVQAKLENLGQHPQPAPKGLRIEKREQLLPAGQSTSLVSLQGPGAIRAMRIFMEPRTPETLRAVRLRVFYNGDKKPSIDAPIGDFFGSGIEDHQWKSLLLGQIDGEFYTYMPMPFEKEVRIELLYDSLGGVRPQSRITLRSSIEWLPMKKWDADLGYFHALWNREMKTRDRVNYTFLRAHGRGHLVGTLQYCDTPKDIRAPFYFEGDEQTYADSMLALHGTGSEDYYNLGWYALERGFCKAGDFPYHGGLYYNLRTLAAYRFHLNDPVVFDNVIHHTMQHGGTDEVEADYASVAFWYQDLPADPLPGLPAVRDRVARNLRPQPSSGSIEMEDMLLRRDRVRTVWQYDLRGDFEFSYGRAARIKLSNEQPVSFKMEVPNSGLYSIYVSALKTPEAPAGLSLWSDGVRIGKGVNFNSQERGYHAKVKLGEGYFVAGDCRLSLKDENGGELIVDRVWLESADWRQHGSLARHSQCSKRLPGGKLQLTYDFNDPENMRHWAVAKGNWEAMDGALSMRSSRDGYLWNTMKWKGDIKMQYRARGPMDLNSILLGNGRKRDDSGYLMVYGGSKNKMSSISVGKKTLLKKNVSIKDTRKFHDIIAEKKDGVLTLSVDAEVILKHKLKKDEDQKEGYIGLDTWSRNTVYEKVVITGTPAE